MKRFILLVLLLTTRLAVADSPPVGPQSSVIVTGAINPVTYGADPTGVKDSTAAFVTAFGSGPVVVVPPPGKYKITGTGFALSDNDELTGPGSGLVQFVSTTTGPTITINSLKGGLRGIAVGPGTGIIRPVGFHEIQVSQSYEFRFEDVRVFGQGGTPWGAFTFIAPRSSGCRMKGVWSDGCQRFLTLTSVNDLFVSQSIAFNQTSNGPTTSLIEMNGFVQAFNMTDCDLIGVNNATCLHVSSSQAQFSKFSNTYFDSAATGVSIETGSQIDFMGCWFSNRPSDCVVVSGGDNIHFTGGQAYNGGGRGFVFSGGFGHLMSGVSVAATNQSQSGPAIQVGSACGGVRILGCNAASIDPLGYSGHSTVGLLIDAGAIKVIANDNDFSGCDASITNNATATTVKIGVNL